MQIIEFIGDITARYIYDVILPCLSNAIRESDQDIVFSFRETTYLAPNTIPLILVIGEVLSKYKGDSIFLMLSYNPSLLYFLYNANFFKIAGDNGIFDYDKEYIGGFSDFVKKKYRSEHKIHHFKPALEYILLKTDEERKAYRTMLTERLYDYSISNVHGLNTVLSDNMLSAHLDAFCEVIANAMIHSKSNAYVFLQSNQFGTFR